jgi:excinuclease ABC subunit C
VEDLHPDPAFPGCIYSEMKMCLALCFKGCTDEEYTAEVGRVQAYFQSGGQSLVREISALRDQASTNLDFENAAAQHAHLEKLKPLLSRLPEIVQRIDHLAGIMVQRSATADSVNFFRIAAGCISGPLTFSIQSAEHTKSQSMESRVQETLAALPPATAKSALENMEHLALLRRWYYRGTKTGEIFFANDKGEIPFRRLVRGISRVYRGEKSEEINATPGGPAAS